MDKKQFTMFHKDELWINIFLKDIVKYYCKRYNDN